MVLRKFFRLAQRQDYTGSPGKQGEKYPSYEPILEVLRPSQRTRTPLLASVQPRLVANRLLRTLPDPLARPSRHGQSRLREFSAHHFSAVVCSDSLLCSLLIVRTLADAGSATSREISRSGGCEA